MADSGADIPASDLAGLFAPFRRSRPHALRGERSTDLGPAIVKRIVDGPGAPNDIANAVGAGATVGVWLPENAPIPTSIRGFAFRLVSRDSIECSGVLHKNTLGKGER